MLNQISAPSVCRIALATASLLATACLPALCQSTAPAAATTIVLDGSSSGRTFDGIGAVSAGASSRLLIDYPEPERSRILDYLFKPGYGAALQHLKIEIGADVNSTDGSEPSYERTPGQTDFHRGYEWWLMEQARARNPHIIFDSLAWGAPGWLRTFYSPQTATYMAGFIKGTRSARNLDIAYTGVWNETPFHADYVKQLAGALRSQNLDTRIVCCDEYPHEGGGQWRIVNVMQSDPALRQDIAVISVHYPRVDGKVTTTPEARAIGKPLWSSEDQPASSATYIHSRDWAIGGRELAELYNDNYLQGAFTATEIWSPVTSYYDILAAPNSGLMYANTPWSGHYDVQGAIWATAHTTQFTQPGWQYLDRSSGTLPGKGDYVAMKSPQGGQWSVILQTIPATQPQLVSFHIEHGLREGVIHIWETNSRMTFAHVADVPVKNHSFLWTFDPDSLYSLTTTTGQGKGTAEPPPARPFPFPWHPDWSSVPLHGPVPYLSDQDGAFQMERCAGHGGNCLEQVITEKPIPWGPLPDPWTLAGNEQWADYSLQSAVYLTGSTNAMLLGRIDSADVFADQKTPLPSGYIFRVDAAGHWSLLSTHYKTATRTLGQGSVIGLTSGWHTLRLSFRGARIEACLDGAALASVRDSTHVHGMAGIGTGWMRMQFDRLSIDPIRTEPCSDMR